MSYKLSKDCRRISVGFNMHLGLACIKIANTMSFISYVDTVMTISIIRAEKELSNKNSHKCLKGLCESYIPLIMFLGSVKYKIAVRRFQDHFASSLLGNTNNVRLTYIYEPSNPRIHLIIWSSNSAVDPTYVFIQIKSTWCWQNEYPHIFTH